MRKKEKREEKRRDLALSWSAAQYHGSAREEKRNEKKEESGQLKIERKVWEREEMRRDEEDGEDCPFERK